MCSMPIDNAISYPEPPPVIKERPSVKKYLRYLLFFGPGAIVASVTIGQGQLILGPQIGAWAGFFASLAHHIKCRFLHHRLYELPIYHAFRHRSDGSICS